MSNFFTIAAADGTVFCFASPVSFAMIREAENGINDKIGLASKTQEKAIEEAEFNVAEWLATGGDRGPRSARVRVYDANGELVHAARVRRQYVYDDATGGDHSYCWPQ